MSEYEAVGPCLGLAAPKERGISLEIVRSQITLEDTKGLDNLDLATQIVVAYLSHNEVSAEALPEIIKAVYRSLATAGNADADAAASPTPAVPARKSVFPDFIVCLEDGKRLKMLKRHLMASYGMTPAQYRAKWGLPHDYPMVAPSHAAKRAHIARSSGLGRKATNEASEPEPIFTR